MRAGRFNKSEDRLSSSFLSCEKDTETIIQKLFIENREYGNILKRLLLINTKDCLDDKANPVYIKKINNTSIKDLRDEGYIRLEPKILLKENEEVKSYILISFDNFTPNNSNPEFRDCVISIDVICHTDYWDIGNYRLRPFKIVGYIDGILNKTKLSGIGRLNLLGCSQIVLNEHLSGYSLMYSAIHGSDDFIELDE